MKRKQPNLNTNELAALFAGTVTTNTCQGPRRSRRSTTAASTQAANKKENEQKAKKQKVTEARNKAKKLANELNRLLKFM